MTEELRELVVDASAAVKLFLPEALSENAERLFEARQREIHVPDLLYAECANVLWRASRQLRLSSATVLGHIEDLLAMELSRVPTSSLAAQALRIALAHDISVYDGCYVAAASELRLPLVTADEKLVRKLAKSRYDVRWLGDFTADQ